jgi:hypothetical protein
VKSLPEFASNVSVLIDFLQEFADELKTLHQFFSGPVQAPAPAPEPVTVAAPVPAPAPVVIKKYTGGRGRKCKCIERGIECKHSGKIKTDFRPMTAEEKSAVLADWNSLPEHLRTKGNRRALAAKHRCSPQQVSAIVNKNFLKALKFQKNATATTVAIPSAS